MIDSINRNNEILLKQMQNSQQLRQKFKKTETDDGI